MYMILNERVQKAPFALHDDTRPFVAYRVHLRPGRRDRNVLVGRYRNKEGARQAVRRDRQKRSV